MSISARRLDLAVVMPIYNEQDCIAEVIASWMRALEAEGVAFRIVALNDGSTDGTLAALAACADSRVEIVDKPNSGHGPTILEGYRRAVPLAEWIFQVDSDDEISADSFASLWRARAGREAVFGVRAARREAPSRWVITRMSRLIVRMLFGDRVKDVNVPFRLMRSDALRSFVDLIPAGTFAPNILIAGAFSRGALPIANVSVPTCARRTGRVSLVKFTLWLAALRSAIETIRCRKRLCVTAPPSDVTEAHSAIVR